MRNAIRPDGSAVCRLSGGVCVPLLAVLAVLAGCGLSSTTPGTSTASGANTDQTATASVIARETATVGVSTTAGADAATGCPGPVESITWPGRPAAIVTPAQGAATVKVGQTLELRLPFGHQWSLGAAMLNGTFTLDSPAGYADLPTRTCIWHFTAKQAGSQDLPIVMAPICQPHAECPQATVAYDITIAATA
jgi:hypothetical protein